MRWLPAALAALTLLGCGADVRRLELRDPRLPVDARRWVADAQDAVVVARARQSDAGDRLAEVRRWRVGLLSKEPLSGDPVAAQALDEMAARRVELARLEVEVTEAELELAQARLTQAYAETAMRHDLEVYELGPILAETEAAAKEALAARALVQERRSALEEATNGWWKAYRAYVGGGGDVSSLWRL